MMKVDPLASAVLKDNVNTWMSSIQLGLVMFQNNSETHFMTLLRIREWNSREVWIRVLLLLKWQNISTLTQADGKLRAHFDGNEVVHGEAEFLDHALGIEETYAMEGRVGNF